jgi:hypothetical protein
VLLLDQRLGLAIARLHPQCDREFAIDELKRVGIGYDHPIIHSVEAERTTHATGDRK